MSSALVDAARELARRAHQGQTRKSGNVPYFTHLEAVTELLELHGHDDELTLAAAWLHDLVEDQPAFTDELRERMPAPVIETVLALTEPKSDAQGNKKPKRERFEAYVAGLSTASEAARRALPISCADKIHNVTSVVESEQRGEGLLMKLGTRPGDQLAHAARLRVLYDGKVAPTLFAAYDDAVSALRATIAAWLPGRAVLIMAEAHLGQFDRGGEPYAYHPMHLGLHAADRDAQMVAFLHDVVEDGDWDLPALAREGFSQAVLRAVNALTRRDAEDYEAFIERVARDRLATRVKLLDLAHNSDLSRLRAPTDEDRVRLAKYRRATARLEDELEKRNLYVKLDAESRARALREARLPIQKAEHVTLAHRVKPVDLPAGWIPGAHRVGDTVELHAVACATDDHAQAFIVEIAGSSVRPSDGGVLHLTVSRAPEARSNDSNTVIGRAPREPVDIPLRGTIEWVDE